MKIGACLSLCLCLALTGCDQQELVKYFVDEKIKSGTKVEAYTLGVKAYTWGLTPSEMYRWLDTMALDTSNPRYAPFNSFYHDTELAGPDYQGFDIPNSDTLYSYAWIDLRDEPVVVSSAGSDGRYYSLQFIDFYSELIEYVSLRNYGDQAAEVLLTGPEWHGEVPAGMVKIESPTRFALLLARVLVVGEEDLPRARDIQRGWDIQTLSSRRGSAPLQGTAVETLRRYQSDNSESFYDQLQYIVNLVPPKTKDLPHWQELKRIGLGDSGSRYADLSLQARQGFERAYNDGPRVLEKALVEAGQSAGGGWAVSRHLGRYGNDYVQRSTVTAKGFGAHLPEEAIYFLAHFDADGAMLSGSNRYRIVVPAELPANGFWSLALYDRASDRLVANTANRYVINEYTPGLQRDANGRATVWVQHDAPEVNEGNWLPAPNGGFYLALRLYIPRDEALSGSWQPPAVQRIE